MLRPKWRRFVPRRKLQQPAPDAGIFSTAKYRVDSLRLRDASDASDTANARKDSVQTATDWLELLLLRTPAAARAQHSIDKRPHERKGRKGRIYELIDFNDAFVSTVLLLRESERREFSEMIQKMMQQVCRQLRVKPFTDEQFTAIALGLTREIALYQAASTRGLQAVMTTREADAFGVDMRVVDETSGRLVNIDCKTRSSFYFRLKDLVHEGRLTQEDMEWAEAVGYCEVTHRHDEGSVQIILLRVSEDDFGELVNFRFADEQALVDKLKAIIEAHGLGGEEE